MTAQLADFLKGREQRHRKRLQFILDEQDRMRRDRALPPQQELLNLTKYELGLNRMLFQAMHELEAVQSRRGGTPIPLARVQISAGG